MLAYHFDIVIAVFIPIVWVLACYLNIAIILWILVTLAYPLVTWLLALLLTGNSVVIHRGIVTQHHPENSIRDWIPELAG